MNSIQLYYSVKLTGEVFVQSMQFFLLKGDIYLRVYVIQRVSQITFTKNLKHRAPQHEDDEHTSTQLQCHHLALMPLL